MILARSVLGVLVCVTCMGVLRPPAVAAQGLHGANQGAAAFDDDTCQVSCSAPVYDDDKKQWYVVVTNDCGFAIVTTVRNNGVKYGIRCAANSTSDPRAVGRTLGDDYAVLSFKRAN